jgi:hypothetical protein
MQNWLHERYVTFRSPSFGSEILRQLLSFADVQVWFNKKAAVARVTVERTFGILKGRWQILRNAHFSMNTAKDEQRMVLVMNACHPIPPILRLQTIHQSLAILQTLWRPSRSTTTTQRALLLLLSPQINSHLKIALSSILAHHITWSTRPTYLSTYKQQAIDL